MDGKLPQSIKEAVQKQKDTNDLINEFRDPTPIPQPGAIHFTPLLAYTIYALIAGSVVIGALYIRYKLSN